MKKILLGLVMTLFCVNIAFAQDGKSYQTAFPVNPQAGAQIVPSEDYVWYKVVIRDESGALQVPEGENLLIKLNNAVSVPVTLYVQAFVPVGMGIEPLDDEATKTLQPNHDYVKEISAGSFAHLRVVYLKVKSVGGTVDMGVDYVEPGEVDLDCVNAPAFNLADQTIRPTEGRWFTVDASELLDPHKTLKVTVTNLGTVNAKVSGGISFDCPSTGLLGTESGKTIKPGEPFVKTLDRTKLSLLPADGIVYAKAIVENAAIRIQCEIITISDAELEAQKIAVEGSPVEIAECTSIAQAAGSQWYKVKIEDFIENHELPEITVENTADAENKLKVEVIFNAAGDVPLSKGGSLGLNEVRVEQLPAAYVATAQAKSTDGYAYLRITSSGSFKAKACLVHRAAGTNACANPIEFEQNMIVKANNNSWIHINIADLQADKEHNVRVYMQNVGTKAVKPHVQHVFNCGSGVPQNDGTPGKAIEVGASKNSLIKHAVMDGVQSDIWFQIETDQNLKIWYELEDAPVFNPVALCDADGQLNDDIEDFDITAADPHVTIPAGRVVKKFRVDYDAIYQMLINEKKVPVILVENPNNAKANIVVKAAFLKDECVLDVEPQQKSHTVAALGTWEYPLTEDLINGVSEDVNAVYLEVSSNVEVNISTVKKTEDAGKSCVKPIEVALDGTKYIQKANTTLIYHVSLADAKALNSGITGFVMNNGSADTKVKGELFYDCPNLLAAQEGTKSIKAGKSWSHHVSSCLIAANNQEEAYLRVTTADEPITLWAQAEADPASDVEISCDKPFDTSIDLAVAQNFTVAAGEKWFKVDLQPLKDNQELTPTVKVKAETDARVDVYYTFVCDCPNMEHVARDLKAGKELSKLIERSMVDAYLGNDFLYALVKTDADVEVSLELVDPNQGQDCAHAIAFDWDNGHDQAAGSVAYYKIDLAHIDNLPANKGIRGNVRNLDGIAGKVVGNAFYECGNETPILAELPATKNLKANATFSHKAGGKEVIRTLLKKDAEFVIVKIETAQEIHLWADEYELDVLAENVCDKAQDFKINKWYTVAEPTWFRLDKAELANTQGDALIRAIAEQATKFTVSFAAKCEQGAEVTEYKQVSLKANVEKDKTVARADIENYEADELFILLNPNAEFRFIVELEDLKGATEADAIEEELNSCFTYVGDNAERWYKFSIKNDFNPAINPANANNGLKITVKNVNGGTVKADYLVKLANGTVLDSDTRTMTKAQKVKDLSHFAIEHFNKDYLDVLVRIKADQEVELCTEVIEVAVPEQKLGILCAGTTVMFNEDDSNGSIINFFEQFFAGNEDNARQAVLRKLHNGEIVEDDAIDVAAGDKLAVTMLQSDALALGLVQKAEKSEVIDLVVNVLSLPEASINKEVEVNSSVSIAAEKELLLSTLEGQASETVASIDRATAKWTASSTLSLDGDVLTVAEVDGTVTLEVNTDCSSIVTAVINIKVTQEPTYGPIDLYVVTKDTTIYECADDVAVRTENPVLTEIDVVSETRTIVINGENIDVEVNTHKLLETTYAAKTALTSQMLIANPAATAYSMVSFDPAEMNGTVLSILVNSREESTEEFDINTIKWYIVDPQTNEVATEEFVPQAVDAFVNNTMHVSFVYTVELECSDDPVTGNANVAFTKYPTEEYVCPDDPRIGNPQPGQNGIVINYIAKQLPDVTALNALILEATAKIGDDAAAITAKFEESIKAVVNVITKDQNVIKFDLTQITWAPALSTAQAGTFEIAYSIAPAECNVQPLTGKATVTVLPDAPTPEKPVITVEKNEYVCPADVKADESKDDEEATYILRTVTHYVAQQLPDLSGVNIEVNGVLGEVDAATIKARVEAAIEALDDAENLQELSAVEIEDKALVAGAQQVSYKATYCAADQVVEGVVNVNLTKPVVYETATVDGGYACEASEEISVTAVETETQITITTTTTVIKAYNALDLALTLDAIEVTCGSTADLSSVDAAIDAALAAIPADQPAVLKENVRIVTADGADFNRGQIFYKGDDLKLNVVATAECSNDVLTIGSVDIKVVPAPAIESENGLVIVEMYPGYLLLVDMVKSQANLGTLNKDNIVWMQVVGAADFESDEADDKEVGRGDYFTLATEGDVKFNGTFYAKYIVEGNAANPCGFEAYSNQISNSVAAKISIAPTIAQPNEDIHIYGLDAQKAYTVNVYNVAGICIETLHIDGVDTYTISAQSAQGYYMLNVQADGMKESFKYFVK